MITELTIRTKELIEDFFSNFIDDEIRDFLPDMTEQDINQICQLAYEELKDNFDKVEFNWQLLQDYYDENLNVPNLEQVKGKCLEFARTLI